MWKNADVLPKSKFVWVLDPGTGIHIGSYDDENCRYWPLDGDDYPISAKFWCDISDIFVPDGVVKDLGYYWHNIKFNSAIVWKDMCTLPEYKNEYFWSLAEWGSIYLYRKAYANSYSDKWCEIASIVVPEHAMRSLVIEAGV